MLSRNQHTVTTFSFIIVLFNGWIENPLRSFAPARSSVRPKRVNTETTETEISVGFTEPKPNRNDRILDFAKY